MRLKRDYIGAIRQKKDWFFSRFKPLTVHTEAIMVDSVWKEIKKMVISNNVKKWYIMTPVNYDFFCSSFNVKKSKQDISNIMKERYAWMINHNQKLELHIHLSLIKNMSYPEQKQIFKEAIDWIKKNLNITVREFVPGWWAYNNNTLKVLHENGLTMIKESDYDFTHDYHWVL